MAILTVGIDLAKNVFAVRGVSEAGKPALVHPAVARDKLHALIAALPPCVVGMEACSGAHHSSAGKASSRRREIDTILGSSDTRKLKLTVA